MGRHAVVEVEGPSSPVDVVIRAPRTALVPHPIPAQRTVAGAHPVPAPRIAPDARPVPRPLAPITAPRPVAVTPATGFPRPAWVPPGYDAPPAGLDGPLDGPAVVWSAPPAGVPRPGRRTTTAAVMGAIGAGVALLATGGTALTALAQTATPAAAPHAVSATSQQCSDAVAGQLDATASALAAGPKMTWSATAADRADSFADRYGRDSAEYSAYHAGTAEILDWLRDPSATESYQAVVDRVVPTVVATCDRAYA